MEALPIHSGRAVNTNDSSKAYLIVGVESCHLHRPTLEFKPLCFEVAHFCVSVIPDLVLTPVPLQSWLDLKRLMGMNDLSIPTYRSGLFGISASGYRQYRQTTELVNDVASGYEVLLSEANRVTESFWSAPSLDQSDLPLAMNFPETWAKVYMEATGVGFKEAVDQVKHDCTLLSLRAAKRKFVVWKYRTRLHTIEPGWDLAEFQAEVKTEVDALLQELC